jgi:hypothetical protein
MRCKMCTSKKHTTEAHQAKLVKGRKKSKVWLNSVVAYGKTRKGSKLSRKHRVAIGKGLRKYNKNNPDYSTRLSKARREVWANRSAKEIKAIARKIAKAQKGRKLSAQHLANLRAANSKPRTAEHRAKISAARKGRPWKARSPEVERERVRKIIAAQQGRVPTYTGKVFWYKGKNGKIAMRSSWEVAYAKYLDNKKEEWKYEPRYFVLGKGKYLGTSYTPDFHLLRKNKYVEIKGYLSRANKNKIARFHSLYPEVSWEILFKSDLIKLGVLI